MTKGLIGTPQSPLGTASVPIPPARNNRKFDVVGLGLNAMDYLIVVPAYPEFNSKIRLCNYTLSPGGQVATALAGLQRLGCRTAYIGSVGSDDLGTKQIGALRAEGIDCGAVRIVEGTKSQIAFILIDEGSGERTIIWDREERLALCEADLDRELITSGSVLHLDGHDIEASALAARWARQAGVPVVLDIDACRPGTEELLENVDYLVSSEQFPERLTGERDHETALRTIQETFGCALAAMTMGRRGVFACVGGNSIHVTAFDSVKVRDTTGAGDAFHAGFIFGLLRELSVRDTLIVANAVAALSCTQVGARVGLPVLDDLRAFLHARGLGSVLQCV